jgi:Kef-type K+ transport system membrane component KefB
MEASAELLVTFGLILGIGLAADYLGRRTRLPRVTLLLLFGVAIGPGGLNLIPGLFVAQFDLVANITLVMVGFLLGEKITLRRLRAHGREILAISLASALGTSLVVTTGLWLVGTPLPMALVLGGIASATAPAATVDVVEQEHARSPFSRLLLSVVAIDDAWGLIIFSLCTAAATGLAYAQMDTALLTHAAMEIFGAIGLGLAIGVPGAALSGRVREGEPILTEALALVFLCGGLALYLEVSFLIAAMVMGATVANLARHHDRPFHAISAVDWPVMILFFVLAGASLETDAVLTAGSIGAAYVVLRVIGKISSGWLGGRLGRTREVYGRWIGVALLPQAGVAMGMALVASSQLPEYRQEILSIAIGSTVLFELAGPFATRLALAKATSQAAHHGGHAATPKHDDSPG